MLIEQAFDDEDGIVISLAEDKGSEDDIDDIKLDAEKVHDSEYPNPTKRHRNEGNERQDYIAERKPEEDKDDERATEADIIEILREAFGEIVETERISGLRIRVQEIVIEGLESVRTEPCSLSFGLYERDQSRRIVRLPIG